MLEREQWGRWDLTNTLRVGGVDVVQAEDAEEAIAHINARSFDFVFSDTRLSGLDDGLNFARAVRARFPDLPIMIATVNLRQSIVEKVGIYIQKPYDPEEIARMILDLLEDVREVA
jgi:DNA-binding NtrC family response regulator